MSDTPRVDAAAYAVIEFDKNGAAYVDHHAVTRDFARQLERELAEARKDAERLNALEKMRDMGFTLRTSITGYEFRAVIDGKEKGPFCGSTLRETIDAAVTRHKSHINPDTAR